MAIDITKMLDDFFAVTAIKTADGQILWPSPEYRARMEERIKSNHNRKLERIRREVDDAKAAAR